MKTLRLKNNKIYTLLKENELLAEEINKMVEAWEKADKEAGKLKIKMDKIKGKIRPLIAPLIKKETELGEFEIVNNIRLEGEEIVVDIADMVELYIEQLRKNKTITKLNGNEENTTGDTEKKD